MAHHFHPTSLREYDIRGRVGQTLSEADAYAIGRGFATILGRTGGQTIAVGRDGRLSSPAFEAALVEGLVAGGADAVRIGLGPTPMLYFAVHHLEADGGVMITGSHNPVDFNGFKFMAAGGPFYGDQIQEIGRLAEAGPWREGQGRARDADVIEAYVDRLLQGYDAPPVRAVWDAGNGAAGPVVERLTRRIPGEHRLLFTDVDGTFPNHHPDPTEEHTLDQLKAAVAEMGAAIGLAFDGDGDRLGAIDGQGRIVAGDQLLQILAEPVLADMPGGMIIGDVKCSQTLFDRVVALGGTPLMWKTGHSLIKAKMKETGAPLAGEMSGHIFFAHDYLGFDDGLYAAVRLLRALGRDGRALAQRRDEMPALVVTPELRVPCADTRKFAVVEEVRARLAAAGAHVNAIDGVRVQRDGGWWLLRASNTQDVLVARAEAADQSRLDSLLGELNAELARSGVAPVGSA